MLEIRPGQNSRTIEEIPPDTTTRTSRVAIEESGKVGIVDEDGEVLLVIDDPTAAENLGNPGDGDPGTPTGP
jgi:hypothetical protein